MKRAARTDSPPSASPMPATVLAGRRVLAQEGAALAALAETLGASFASAGSLLLEAEGRVVVTGIGKSGHVARKIAATFASTGTQALFVHPAEASHGDLGMIGAGDVVLALSNSGETTELHDIVAYAARWDLPLIAITSQADSTLGRAAAIVLELPAVGEACPMGLAPTSSTTMSLALGDALAVAVLEARGFTARDFRDYHPGGKLGRLLVRVADLMHRGEEVPLVEPGAGMDTALLRMTAKRFGCVGIAASGGALQGIITDGDLRRHMAADLLDRRVEEVMTAAPRTVTGDMLAAEALRIMNERAITSLFVVDAAGQPVGILHIHDLLRAHIA